LLGTERLGFLIALAVIPTGCESGYFASSEAIFFPRKI
jgi:hypothetical protein